MSNSTWEGPLPSVGLTGYTLQGGNARSAETSSSRNAGKVCARVLLLYPNNPVDEGPYFGAAPATWNPETDPYIGMAGNALTSSGYMYPASVDTGLVILSGEFGFIYEDIDAGMGWFDNESDSTASDREAGINPHYTFTPNSDRVLGIAAYCSAIAPVSIVADLDYASGSFNNWG